MADDNDKTIWVMSNRQDDRAVLWERDAAHPGGEAFIASGVPDHVARTGEVERLLRSGELVEVPEPADGPKKPVQVEAVDLSANQDGPGRPTRLGRKPDPELFNDGEVKRIEAKQEDTPDSLAVPADAIVPPDESTDRTRSRR